MKPAQRNSFFSFINSVKWDYWRIETSQSMKNSGKLILQNFEKFFENGILAIATLIIDRLI